MRPNPKNQFYAIVDKSGNHWDNDWRVLETSVKEARRLAKSFNDDFRPDDRKPYKAIKVAIVPVVT